jgi:hypothetical protein
MNAKTPVETKTERKVNTMKKEENKESNTPVRQFRAGVISATVWQNAGKPVEGKEPGTYNTVSIQRSYKDKEDNWQTTTSMRLNDLPRAALVLNKAYEFLTMEKQKAEVA